MGAWSPDARRLGLGWGAGWVRPLLFARLRGEVSLSEARPSGSGLTRAREALLLCLSYFNFRSPASASLLETCRFPSDSAPDGPISLPACELPSEVPGMGVRLYI